jgi:hypothetical protein
MLIMEGRDEEMDIDVTTQQDDNSIPMGNDQIMEDKSEHDSKQVTS